MGRKLNAHARLNFRYRARGHRCCGFGLEIYIAALQYLIDFTPGDKLARNFLAAVQLVAAIILLN